MKSEAHVEPNDVELYVDVGGKQHILKNNKDRITDLMQQKILSEEKLTNQWPYYFGFWLKGVPLQKEVIYVRIKNFG